VPLEASVDVADVNETITLDLPRGEPLPRLGEPVVLVVANNSSAHVVVDERDGVRAFVRNADDSGWLEVENAIHDPASQVTAIGPKGGEVPSVAAFYFVPLASGDPSELQIRFVVLGSIVDAAGELGNPVAACMALTIER
jgi:hypothetical protein